MTVAEYLGKKDNEPEFFTVEELRDKLNELIADGFGRAAVLLEKSYNPENYAADYIFVDKQASFEFSNPTTVRLDLMSPENDAYVAKALGFDF